MSLIVYNQIQMIGPHYERLAQIENRMTAKQMMEKMKNRPDNPLSRVVDKLKRQFGQYQTAYNDPIMDYQISSLDRILSFDSKLGPILDALQRQNLLLRKQLGVLQGQLSNTVSICDQILAENNQLKLIVRRKNEDISKIIETVGTCQGQQLDDLEQKNALLLKQNSILMLHLQELKRQQTTQAMTLEQYLQERDGLERRVEEMKKQLSESMGRQKDLSRRMAQLEQNLYQSSDQNYKLIQEKQNLTFQNNQLTNQISALQARAEGAGPQALQQLESQYEPILEQHRLLKRERTQLLREAEKLKREQEQNEQVNAQLQRQVYKLTNDLELTASLLKEEKARNAALTANLTKIQGRAGELREQNNTLRAERQTSSNYAITREKRLLAEVDDLRQALQGQRAQAESRMREIGRSMQGLLDSKQVEIKGLREQNLQLQRLVDRR